MVYNVTNQCVDPIICLSPKFKHTAWDEKIFIRNISVKRFQHLTGIVYVIGLTCFKMWVSLDVDWWLAGLLFYIQTRHFTCTRKRGWRKSMWLFPVSFLSLTGSCFTCYWHMCTWVYLSLCFLKKWIPSHWHLEHFEHLSTTRWGPVLDGEGSFKLDGIGWINKLVQGFLWFVWFWCHKITLLIITAPYWFWTLIHRI